MRKKLYLSGEFARLCKVNKKTLFYYDEIDLFKPAIVEDNGYRYYTYDQIDSLSKIKALQSVGLSLNEIKKQLFSQNVSEGIQTLYTQKQAINNKMLELQQLEDTLNQKLSDLEHYRKVGNDQIYIVDCLDEYLIVDEQLEKETFIINYMMEGYHSGVILNGLEDPNNLLKTRKYRKTKYEKEANYIKEKGKYVGLYFLAEDKKIIECAKKAYLFIKNSSYLVQSEIYLEDIASDFINYSNGKIPFKITAKIMYNK